MEDKDEVVEVEEEVQEVMAVEVDMNWMVVSGDE